MKHIDTPQPQYEQPEIDPDFGNDAENLVVFTWAVPCGAKVPAPRQHPALKSTVVPAAAISSTVPAAIVTELRVNNTALGAGWCYTATLAAPSGRA